MTISADPRLVGLGALVAGVLAVSAADAQTIRRVPQDYATIQAAIDAAVEGDHVLVAPGTYAERIAFAKAITVESQGGRDVTILDGGMGGTVVRITADPGKTPVLRGFTVRNGYEDVGGVLVYGGPALVEDNLITKNFGCFGALQANFSSATIRANTISDNRANCSPGFGGGMAILGAGAALILDNVIEGNSSGSGGGIGLNAAGTPTISGNLIRNNSGSEGGGISMGNSSDPQIVNNVIVGNSAVTGGGIHMSVPLGQRVVANNTIAGNTASTGSAIFVDGFVDTTRIVNNILVGSSGTLLVCGGNFGTSRPVMAFNDVFHTTGGGRYGGICINQTGMNGNISADPYFLDAAGGNFHLRRDSPAIEAATNAEAPAKDKDGNSRPGDGNGDSIAVSDMGAYEYQLRPLGFFTLTPCRVADTRDAVGPLGGPALAANAARTFPVLAACGVPNTATAIAANVTVVDETDDGDLRIFAAGDPAPGSSVINFAAGRVRANNAIVFLGAGGQIVVQCDMPALSTGHAHFLLDVMGYFE